MTMYHAVTDVAATDDYTLVVRFDNGEQRVLNVRPLLTTGQFRRLADPAEFRRVRVAYDTVEWDNGLDLDPEYVYDQSKAICAEPCVADR
jgi:hypothetical protein